MAGKAARVSGRAQREAAEIQGGCPLVPAMEAKMKELCQRLLKSAQKKAFGR
jgi:hypothetical protein